MPQVERWPFRKLNSLEKLMRCVEEQQPLDPEGTAFVLAKMEHHRQEIINNPAVSRRAWRARPPAPHVAAHSVPRQQPLLCGDFLPPRCQTWVLTAGPPAAFLCAQLEISPSIKKLRQANFKMEYKQRQSQSVAGASAADGSAAGVSGGGASAARGSFGPGSLGG